jgi:hypothetical protein
MVKEYYVIIGLMRLGKQNTVQSKGKSFVTTAVVYSAGAPLGVRSCTRVFELRGGGGGEVKGYKKS